MASTGIKELGDQLIELTVKEVQELAQYLKEVYGIEYTSTAIPAGSVYTVNHDLPTKTNFNVVLKSAGANKLQIVKLVKDLTGLGLKESKDLVDLAPKTIKEGLPKDEANNIKNQLVNAGADVELV